MLLKSQRTIGQAVECHDLSLRRRGVVSAVLSDGDLRVERFDGSRFEARPSELRVAQFDGRVRFNWGFHEGVAVYHSGKKPAGVGHHGDRAYAVGFCYGVAAASGAFDTDSSDPAWLEVERRRANMGADAWTDWCDRTTARGFVSPADWPGVRR